MDDKKPVTVTGSPSGQREPETTPIFGIIAMGGVGGATIREIRLANELSRRGFDVHFWWMLRHPGKSALAPSVHQHRLFLAARYRFPQIRGLAEFLQGFAERSGLIDDREDQDVPDDIIEIIIRNYLRLVCDGLENDKVVVDRFLKDARAAKVTHLIPSLAIFAPFAFIAREQLQPPPKCLVQFQGEELAITYATRAGFGEKALKALREIAKKSDWPPAVCSEDYAKLVSDDIGLDVSSLHAITPGVPQAEPIDKDDARQSVKEAFSEYQPDKPLVTFVGRQDTEKGIDLFLYASKILREKGVPHQVMICGPSGFGISYKQALKQITEVMRMEVIWQDSSPPKQLLNAILATSHCVVYPSVHREPFGMVPAEAAAYGTPSVVPDRGGLPEAIRAGDVTCGLRFRPWDSGDLANRIERLITDEDLWQQLSNAGPQVARHHSIERMTDRVLDHMGLARLPEDNPPQQDT